MRDAGGKFSTGGNGGFWDDARVARLRLLTSDKDKSASEIAEYLGCSRNAVIGKCKRMEIELAAPHVAPQRIKSTTHQRAPMPVAAPLVPVMELAPEPTSRTWIRFIKMRPYSCRWPVSGVPGPEMLCCGAKRVEDKPYCSAHCDIAYRGVGNG